MQHRWPEPRPKIAGLPQRKTASQHPETVGHTSHRSPQLFSFQSQVETRCTSERSTCRRRGTLLRSPGFLLSPKWVRLCHCHKRPWDSLCNLCKMSSSKSLMLSSAVHIILTPERRVLVAIRAALLHAVPNLQKQRRKRRPLSEGRRFLQRLCRNHHQEVSGFSTKYPMSSSSQSWTTSATKSLWLFPSRTFCCIVLRRFGSPLGY